MPGFARRSTRLVVLFSALLFLTSFDIRGQGRPTVTTGAPSGQTAPATGVILGRVIDGDTGRPVAGAMVILGGGPRPAAAAAATMDLQLAQQQAATMAGARRGGASPITPVLTAADGAFLVRDLAAGTYNLSVQAAGYAPGVFGRRRPDGPVRGIDLAQEERLTDIVVRVWKYGVISGTVTDEAGEPVVGVSVRAVRRNPGTAGHPFQAGPSAETDDRGMYRVSSLLPGEYVVVLPSKVTTLPVSLVEGWADHDDAARRSREENAVPFPSAGVVLGDLHVSTWRASWPAPGPGADGRAAIYPTTFHPAATSITGASIVKLASGEERTGIDLHIKLITGARVSGVAMTPDGPAAGMGVRLVPAALELNSSSGFESAETATDASGRFTFVGVPPGAYVATTARQPRAMPGARGVPPPGAPGTGPQPTAPALWGEQPVTVGTAEVRDVAIAMRPGATVAGTFEFEGATPRPPAQRLQAVTVSLQWAGGRIVSPGGVARPDGEGRFKTSPYPPGRYWLNVTAPGPEWSIKAITVNGLDALTQPFDLAAGPVEGVQVTFTDRVAQINGTVQGDPGSIDGASIVIFPADFQTWIAGGMSPRRQYSAIASKTGAFQARVPVAGEYLVAALRPESPVDSTAAFFAALARTATRVMLSEGEARTVTLPVGGAR